MMRPGFIADVEASADAGLVGDDHQGEASSLGGGAQREDAGLEVEIRDAVDPAGITVDDAVTVEEEGRGHDAARRFRDGRLCFNRHPAERRHGARRDFKAVGDIWDLLPAAARSGKLRLKAMIARLQPPLGQAAAGLLLGLGSLLSGRTGHR